MNAPMPHQQHTDGGVPTGTKFLVWILLFILSLALVPAHRLFAAAPAQATTPAPLPTIPSEDLNRIRAAGKLIVGTSADYAPYAFYNSNFQLDGFDIKLMDEIGRELGVTVEYKTFAFASLLDALRLGQVDAAIGALSVTPERQAIVDFSNIYYISDGAALVRANDTLTIRELSDFTGKKVVVEAGTTYQSLAQNALVDKGIIAQQDLLAADSMNEVISALRSGTADVALLGALPAASLDSRYADIKIGGTGFSTQQYAIAMRKGSDLVEPINQGLIAIQADGRYGALVQQFLRDGSPTPAPGDTGLIPLPPIATAIPTATPPAPTASPTVAPSATPLPNATAAPTLAATPTPVPPTATPTLAPSPTPTAVPCVYSSAFVKDLTFDDKGMTAPPQMIPGLTFDKTWRLLNSGSCAWQPDFALFYVNGNRPEAFMNGRPVPVGRVVRPGETIDMTASLMAPSTFGIFQGFWQMRNNLGQFFGETVWVGINVPNPNPPTATPVPPPPPTATPGPTQPPPPVGWTGNPNLRADSQFVNPGQCTNIRWDVDGVNSVFFVDGGNAIGKGGHDLQTVCPGITQTYELRVITLDNQTKSFFITIQVVGAPTFTINFWADRTQINRGECTTLRWDVQGVQAVFYQDQGVPGVSSRQECPGSDRTYRLRVVRTDGGEVRRDVFVRVIQRGESGGAWTPDQ